MPPIAMVTEADCSHSPPRELSGSWARAARLIAVSPVAMGGKPLQAVGRRVGEFGGAAREARAEIVRGE